MNNVICFRHPGYDGKSSPSLSCKTCCTKFLGELKRKNNTEGENTTKWLQEKTKMAEDAIKHAKEKK